MNKPPFLDFVLDEVLKHTGSLVEDVVYILPGRRSGNRLKKAIAGRLERPGWAPPVMTWNEWAEKQSGGKAADQLTLLGGLFDSLRNMEANGMDSLHEFMNWGQGVLSDFSEADLYLLDTRFFFQDLRHVKEIDNWSLSGEDLTEWQLAYLHFWDRLAPLYEKFTAWQDSMQLFTYGRLLRTIAEKRHDEWSTLPLTVFAGFASFAPAELAIVNALALKGKALCIWDADAYYVNNKNHEAGSFIRTLPPGPPHSIHQENYFSDDPPRVSVVSCSSEIAQVDWLTHVVAQWSDEEWNNSVVILADPALSGPTKQALAGIGRPVIQGLSESLAETQEYGFTRLWLAHVLRNRTDRRGWYWSDLLELLSFPFVSTNTTALQEIRAHLISGSMIYLRSDLLLEWVRSYGLPSWILQVTSEPADPLDWLVRATEVFGQMPASGIREKWIDQLAVCKNFLTGQGWENEWKRLREILDYVVRRATIPRQELNETGLLVTGLIETRALDFNHVIILSAGENQLPGSSLHPSNIPFDVRRLYQLPLQSQTEALYAYHFYRLIQRASAVQIAYSPAATDYAYSEPTRYISQMKSEWPSGASSLSFSTYTWKPKSASAHSPGQNNHFIRGRIEAWMQRGISPSSLNTFIRCPLDFYHQYLLGLGEKEEMEETLGAATFGSIIHHVLEQFFKPFVDSYPEAKDFQKLIEQLEEQVVRSFAEITAGGDSSSGLNYLALHAIRHMLEKFIRFSSSEEPKPTRLIGVEIQIRHTIERSLHTWPFEVALRGTADRAEEYTGHVRILDYKSGSVEPRDLKIPGNLEILFTDTAKSKCLQLMIYSLCWCRMNQIPADKVEAGIYSFRKPGEGIMSLNAADQGALSEELLSEFEKELVRTLEQIWSCEHFIHNPDSLYCRYCHT